MQLILSIHVLCICKQSCLLKCSCNPKINTCSTFHCHSQKCQTWNVQRDQKLEFAQCICSQLRSNSEALPSFISSHEQIFFYNLFNARFFIVLYFLLVIWLFTVGTKGNVEVLSSVPKCRKAYALQRKYMYQISFIQA